MMYFEGLDQLEKQRDSIRTKFGRSVDCTDRSDFRSRVGARKTQAPRNRQQHEAADRRHRRVRRVARGCGSHLQDRKPLQRHPVRDPFATRNDRQAVGPQRRRADRAGRACVGFRRRAVRRRRSSSGASGHLQGIRDRPAPVLANLYPAISKMLEESGVFPSLEELREVMQRSMRRSAPKARPEPTQNYQELEGPVREAAMAADGISMAPRTSYNPFAPEGRRYCGGLQGRARAVEPRSPRAPHAGRTRSRSSLRRPNAAPDQRYDPRDILQAISQIESELGDAPVTDSRLKPRLMEVLEATARRQEGIRRGAVRHAGRDGEPGRFDRTGQAADRGHSRLGQTVGDSPSTNSQRKIRSSSTTMRNGRTRRSRC